MPIIDIHIHVQPPNMYRPEAQELMKRGRSDYAEVEKYSASPTAFLKFLDETEIERAGLINTVSPEVIGSPPEINDWIANYCSAAPKRLLAFGSVHPKYV